MQITVTAKKMDLTPSVKKYAEEKIGKLDKYLEGIREAHILIRVEKHRHIAEATLRARHADFSGKEDNEDLFAAIDKLADKIERQIKKYKTKTLNRRKSKGAQFPEDYMDTGSISILRTPGDSDAETIPIVEEKFIHLDRLTADEAISRMEVHGDNFWVYSDSQRGQMAVVYRRRDGSYGLIQAQD